MPFVKFWLFSKPLLDFHINSTSFSHLQIPFIPFSLIPPETFSIKHHKRSQENRKTLSKKDEQRHLQPKKNSVCNFCVCLIVSQHILCLFLETFLQVAHFLPSLVFGQTSKDSFRAKRSASCMAFFAFRHRLFSLMCNGYWISEILLFASTFFPFPPVNC